MNDITVEFRMCRDLMGFALGKIPLAPKLDGVNRIEIEDPTNTFKITGETDEAARNASLLLEFSEESVQVPRNQFVKPTDENQEKSLPIGDESGVIPLKVFTKNDHKFYTKKKFV